MAWCKCAVGKRLAVGSTRGNGDGTVPAVARSLREYGRAMARRRGRFAELRHPVTPMLAHMLARAVDVADFGPSRYGAAVMGAAPARAHSLRESRGAMAVRRRRCSLIACRCLTTTTWPTRNQQTPYQCAHRMQISTSYRHESRRSASEVCLCKSSTCQIPCNALPPDCARPPHVVCNKSRPSASTIE